MKDEWVDIVDQALGQWEKVMTKGTTKLISVEPTVADCVSDPEALMLTNADRIGEVRMIGVVQALLELPRNPFKICILGAPACAVSPNYANIERKASDFITRADILLKRSYFETRIPVIPDKVAFNQCFSGENARGDNSGTFYLYATLVHEAGHALGMSDRGIDDTALNLINETITPLPDIVQLLLPQLLALRELGSLEMEYEVSYPTIAESVLNYDREVGPPGYVEPDCSPHPFDMLALSSLYQKTYYASLSGGRSHTP